MTRTALVIGGGIAGPATALALQKAGIEPIVYEAHPAHADGTGGVPDARDQRHRGAARAGRRRACAGRRVPDPAITLRNGAGRASARRRTGLALRRPATRSSAPTSTPPFATKRVRAASALEHGKRLVDARDSGGDVRAVFADGSEAAGDVLVGCRRRALDAAPDHRSRGARPGLLRAPRHRRLRDAASPWTRPPAASR